MLDHRIDTLFRYVGASLAVSGFVIAAGMIFYLLSLSIPALYEVGFLRFFSDSSWYPSASGDGTFGLFPMVVASLLVGVMSIVVAVPIALTAVFFAEFFASKFQESVLRRGIEILGAIPSVVFGLVGITVIVPIVNSIASPGTALLSAVLVLVPMIVPTAALFYFAAIESLPTDLPKVAAALNLSRFRYVFQVVLPSIRRQVISGGLLAFARAIGETMAVLMVAGNVIQIPGSIFDPVRVLTANIALEMGYALGVHRSSLFLTGFIMVVFVLLILALAEIVTRYSKRSELSAV